jgi:hypothetical protein
LSAGAAAVAEGEGEVASKDSAAGVTLIGALTVATCSSSGSSADAKLLVPSSAGAAAAEGDEEGAAEGKREVESKHSEPGATLIGASTVVTCSTGASTGSVTAGLDSFFSGEHFFFTAAAAFEHRDASHLAASTARRKKHSMLYVKQIKHKYCPRGLLGLTAKLEE